MKKYISLFLIIISIISIFAGCMPTHKKSNALHWEEEDIELSEVLPELKSTFVNVTEDITIELVDSPFVFTSEEILAKVKGSESFRNYTFKVKTEEIGTKESMGGIAINLLDTIYCYKDSETQPYFHIDITRCLPTTTNITSVHVYITETNMDDFPIQEKWSELFTLIFGEKIGHAMLYAKDKDSVSDNQNKNMLHEKVMFDYTGHYYTVYRSVEKYDDKTGTGDFQLNISSGAINMYQAYKGDYKTVAKTFKYNAADLFNNRLGEQTDIFATNIFNKYMSIGKTEDDGDNFGMSVLNGYSYGVLTETNGEHTYESSLNFYQYTGPDFSSSINNSANLSITFSLTEDKNGNISNYSYHISGKARDIDKADTHEEILNEKEEKLEKILEDIKEQLVLVFGDSLDIAELSIDNFEITNSQGEPIPIGGKDAPQSKTNTKNISPSYLATSPNDYGWGESYGYLGEIRRNILIPATFDFYGQQQQIYISIILNSNLEKWSGEWQFSYPTHK